MTATRWKSNALEMLDWFDEEPENLIVSLSNQTMPIIEGEAENQDEQIPVNSEEEEDQIPSSAANPSVKRTGRLSTYCCTINHWTGSLNTPRG